MSIIIRLLPLMIVAVAQVAPPVVEAGFISLFNGRDFTGWKIAGPAETFTIQDGAHANPHEALARLASSYPNPAWLVRSSSTGPAIAS